MILFVKEVDLVCELADSSLIEFVCVLDTENLKVLAALVELLKALNFLFSGVDLLFE